MNVIRLISNGRTIAAAAKILNIKHKTASLHLANAYGRAFGTYMGSGSATVRTQLLTLLDYAFTVRALVPPPAGRLALGELPRRILPLVVAGVPTGEQADRLGRTPADVAAATKRLREEAGLGPHEYWNRAVGWGHANGLLAPIASSAVTPEPADTMPATGVTSQPLCARALRA
ncbi:hypothetical protein [Streptomyces sp. H27-H5]|uniref:hypothetical protein n=1 Tax=Streptomyces sp. H27-H5 TaxID=2996460 RepID=UPI00226F3B3F|nr:hypothetical protein [Streptomyces sp. H27-H5]MCY0962507.1 hypothetical protein [Streptomyces sp. H27-H5]